MAPDIDKCSLGDGSAVPDHPWLRTTGLWEEASTEHVCHCALLPFQPYVLPLLSFLAHADPLAPVQLLTCWIVSPSAVSEPNCHDRQANVCWIRCNRSLLLLRHCRVEHVGEAAFHLSVLQNLEGLRLCHP